MALNLSNIVNNYREDFDIVVQSRDGKLYTTLKIPVTTGRLLIEVPTYEDAAKMIFHNFYKGEPFNDVS